MYLWSRIGGFMQTLGEKSLFHQLTLNFGEQTAQAGENAC